MSEWLKVMLEEIARKRAEAEAACIEEQRRQADMLKSGRCEPRNTKGDTD